MCGLRSGSIEYLCPYNLSGVVMWWMSYYLFEVGILHTPTKNKKQQIPNFFEQLDYFSFLIVVLIPHPAHTVHQSKFTEIFWTLCMVKLFHKPSRTCLHQLTLKRIAFFQKTTIPKIFWTPCIILLFLIFVLNHKWHLRTKTN